MALKFTASITTAAIQKLIEKIEDLPNAITKKDADDMGKECANEMKKLIGQGNSPVGGFGSFPPYRGQYRDRINRGLIRGKSLRPVNLKLKGDFLNSLENNSVRADYGYGFTIGYRDSLSQKKEQGHREGANGQAIRPTIPQETEGFAKSVKDIYIRFMQDAIGRIIKRSIS